MMLIFNEGQVQTIVSVKRTENRRNLLIFQFYDKKVLVENQVYFSYGLYTNTKLAH